jgi:hypothetical protein
LISSVAIIFPTGELNKVLRGGRVYNKNIFTGFRKNGTGEDT